GPAGHEAGSPPRDRPGRRLIPQPSTGPDPRIGSHIHPRRITELPIMKRLVLSLGLVAAAAVFAACGGSSAAAPVPSGPVDPNGPTIVAKDMKFQTSNVDVKAG